MEKKNKRNNHMMNKGMKQKVSVLLILCLLLTGYRGLTISGKAEQSEKKESNAISVSGTEVKVQLHGEDLRKAAKEAIEKGDKVEGDFLKGYSTDEELQKEYEAVFSPEKEVYEIPLDSISEGLSESLSEEEAGLQIFVERDAKDLESLVRKESKESLLLYDGNSQISKLFPEGKNEEKQNVEKAKKNGEKEETTVSEEGSLASDSNIKRNTELTGSELITFLYKNKSDHKISFKLSVDGNQYPKLAVAPKTQLFKALVEKLKQEEKKAQAEVKPAEKQEEKSIEKQEEKTKEEAVKAETSEDQKEISEEAASVEEKKELSGKEDKPASEVSIVSTEGKTEETQAEEEKAEKNKEKKEENKVETAEAETKEESAEKSEEAEKDGAKLTEVKKDSTKPAEAEKEVPETEKQSGEGKEAKEKAGVTGFLGEVLEHYEEFQGELVSARFTQYSLNELGRKSQNVEIEGFATVEVFYDDEAFTDADGKVEEVVLEAKRLLKPEETEKEGEKLTEEQVEAMKEHAIYEDSDALDIRFVSKDDNTKEIEPKTPVSVRLTFDKKAVPEEATADTIAIHHLLESKDSGKIELVETVLRSEKEKEADKNENLSEEKQNPEEIEGLSLEKEKEEKDESKLTDIITKEFTVTSFSPFVVKWNDYKTQAYHGIRIYYVDRNGREIGPTRYYRLTDQGKKIKEKAKDAEAYEFYNKDTGKIDSLLDYNPSGYLRWGLFGISNTTVGALYNGAGYQVEVKSLTANYFVYTYQGVSHTSHFGDKCEYTDFVFVYYLCGKAENKPKPDDTTPDLKNEKYITDNLDGTYDLTLTGQSVVSGRTSKKPLDIVFVYDNTAIMATDFSFDGTKNNTEGNDASSREEKKSTKVKEELKSFMEKMSSHDSAYDTRYALVTMDGMKEHQYDLQYRAKYSTSYMTGKMDGNLRVFEDNDYPDFAYAKGIEDTKKGKFVGEFQGKDENGQKTWLEKSLDNRKNWKGEFIGDRQRSADFTIEDGEEDDTAYVHGFTSRLDDILSYLKNLQEGKTTVTKLSGSKYSEKISGENYTAAIRNVRALLQKDIPIKANREAFTQYKARDDAKKIVVFIAGGDPKYAYIQNAYPSNNEYQYDDILRFKDQTDGIQYYRTRAWYKVGYSIGNGRSIDFAALNQARGELHQITDIDAFYSIGVGNEKNWNYLNDFAMGQWYDKNFAPAQVPTDKKDKDGKTIYVSVEGKADLRENALVKKTLYKCFDGSDASKLNKSFDEIYKRVAVDGTKNIVIRDVLTKNVQPIMKNGKPDVIGQLVKMKPNGNNQAVEVEDILKPGKMADLGLNGFTIEAKEVYAGETGISGLSYTRKRWLLTLKTDPEDFALPAGYDIRMVAKVEPTEEAKRLFESDSGYKDKGDKRTDLNDIYETYLHRGYHEDGKSDSMFNSSADKYGLFTNEYADITYKTKKPDGSESSPQTKKYNKPIISKGSLIIEKTFSGLEGTKLIDSSSGNITDFGKKVLKQLKFIVKAEEFQGLNSFGQKHYEFTSLLELNLQANSWWTEPANFKDGVTSEVTGSDNFKHKVTLKIVQESGKAPQLKITVDNLIPSKRYQIWEYCNKPDGAVEKVELSGSAYQLKDVSENANPIISQSGSKSLDSSEPCKPDNVFKITNHYEKKDNPKTITVKKVVTGMARPTASSTEKFKFHLVIKKHDGGTGQSLSEEEMDSIINDMIAKNANSTEFEINKDLIKLKRPKKINAFTISFELKDGESIQIPLKPNYLFQVYEKKSAGYEKAKIVSDLKGSSSRTIQAETGQDDNNEFTYMEALEEPYEGEIITFQNPAKFTIPTGLTRDTTPYLFSIFGFVAMAWVYLTIRKKKRIEI